MFAIRPGHDSRQRAQQHAVDDREDVRRGADASPRVSMATAANPGLWRSVRQAYAMSCARIPWLYSGSIMARAAGDVTNVVTGAAAHLGIDLADYDAKIRTFIPEYETMIDSAAFALQITSRRRTPVVVDLGIGTRRAGGAVPGADSRRADRRRGRRRGDDRGRTPAAWPPAAVGHSRQLRNGGPPAVRTPSSRHSRCTTSRLPAPADAVPAAACRPAARRSTDLGPIAIRKRTRGLPPRNRATWMKHLENSYTPSVARPIPARVGERRITTPRWSTSSTTCAGQGSPSTFRGAGRLRCCCR
jgi:hypothetical protein